MTRVLHVLQLCFLCFTLLKAMLLYHIFTGFSRASSTHSSDPLVRSSPSSSFFLSTRFLTFFAFTLSLHVPTLSAHLLRSVSVRTLRGGDGGLSVSLSAEPSLPVVDHKLNTERKCVGQFGWWCACTCSSVCFWSSSVPPPSSLTKGVQCLSRFLLVFRPAIYDATQELQGRMRRE